VWQVKADALAKFASSSQHKLKVYGGSLVDLKRSPASRAAFRK
jgi:hypothetical protein